MINGSVRRFFFIRSISLFKDVFIVIHCPVMGRLVKMKCMKLKHNAEEISVYPFISCFKH
jgi:hypothetical protein